MNFELLYAYRHASEPQESRDAVWSVIAGDLYRRMGSPERVLDLACGRGEFIKNVEAPERWGVDQSLQCEDFERLNIRMIVGDSLEAQLPTDYFDAILLSNVLEHLDHFETIQLWLERAAELLRPGGVVAILGPNFKYTSKQYFDCADHVLPLTHISISEHLYAAKFQIETVIPRFLPYSFRGMLPPSPTLTGIYLNMPLAWKVLGKQFLVIGRR